MRKVSILVVALLVAACNDAPETQPGPPPDTAGGRPDVSHPEIAPAVAVKIGDAALDVSHDSVQAVGTGQMSFSVQNSSKASQQFTIDGGELGKWTSTPIAPGQAVLMSQLMQRGIYQLIWPGPPELKKQLVIY